MRRAWRAGKGICNLKGVGTALGKDPQAAQHTEFLAVHHRHPAWNAAWKCGIKFHDK